MRTRSKSLTAAAAAKARPGDARREIADGGSGLFLVVQPSGGKSWAVRLRRPNGKTAKLTLGPFAEDDAPGEPVIGSPLTLAGARQLATVAQRQRAQGQDPAERRQHAKADAAGTSYPTIAERFVREHAQPKTRRWRETTRLLGLDPDSDLAIIPNGLADRWRGKSVRDITADDVHALIKEVGRRGPPGLKRRTKGAVESRARAAYSALSVMFRWARAERLVTVSPIAGVQRPKAPGARSRVLSDPEIKALWRACEAMGPPAGTLVRFLLVTGCRLDEAREMPRAEVGADGIWTIPGTRTKNHREHALPLPPLALQLIEATPRINPDAYVFTLNGTTPLGSVFKVKQRLGAALRAELGEVPHWVLHDLRRTAVSGMARAGVDLHIIERIVNHSSGSFGGIVGVYQRHKFESEMRTGLEKWAALLLRVV